MGTKQTTFLPTAWSQHRLTATVAISLIAHLLGWGAVIWTGVLDPAVILAEKPDKKRQLSLKFIKPRPKPKPPTITTPEPPPPPKKKELPNIFVQVEPKQASTKKPEDTDKYSNQNSLATNPESGEQPQPKINGTQKETPRARDIPQPPKDEPQPETIPAPESARKPVELASPKKQPAPRQAATPSYRRPAKPRTAAQSPGPRPEEKQATAIQLNKPASLLTPYIPSRPTPILLEPGPSKPNPESALERSKRRLANAQRPSQQLLPGASLKQKGGVPRKGAPAFNVTLTGYGNYDNKLITAIYNSWIRKNREARMHEPYRVVVEFTLLDNGRIKGLRVMRPSSTASQSIPEFICQRSITEPSPFEKWDEKMKRALGTRRPCRITFSFNIRD